LQDLNKNKKKDIIKMSSNITPSFFQKNKDKVLACSSVLVILIGIFGLGYGYTAEKDGFEPTPGDDNYTVSYAIGNGVKPAIAVFIAVGGLIGISLVKIKRGKYKFIRQLLIALIASLLISLMYINPTIIGGEDNEQTNKDHGILAISAFTCALIFNLITFYIIEKSPITKWSYWILAIANITVYLGIYIILYIIVNNSETFFQNHTMNEVGELGAAVEIFQILFFLLAILLTGFCSLKPVKTLV
tara:strand:+ start:49 stop:783 length:735 start_codon:yes stop_codon:yes gene_type:complete